SPDLLLHRVVEAAADAGHVPELVALVDPDVQRAEAPPAAARVGVAADHELLPLLAFELHPVGGALPGVGAARALPEDAFEPHLGSGIEERLAVLLDVAAGLRRPRRRQ